jgi:hypothetical protein
MRGTNTRILPELLLKKNIEKIPNEMNNPSPIFLWWIAISERARKTMGIDKYCTKANDKFCRRDM